MTTLSISSLSVRYGNVTAVSGANLEIQSGSVTAIVGPNGAGKSSLLLATAGAIRVETGSVMLDGENLTPLSANARSRKGVILVPQGRQIFGTLTVRENLHVMADSLRLSSDRVEEALDRFPILRERWNQPGGVLSGGEQQMLALARAIMGRPKVLLLDEPLLGLAPLVIDVVLRTIRDMASSGMALVMVEPSMRLIRGEITRGYVLLRGQIVDVAESAGELSAVYARRMGLDSVSC